MKEELARLGASAEGCCARSEIAKKLRQVRKAKVRHGFSAAGQDREDKQMEAQLKDKMEREKSSHKGVRLGVCCTYLLLQYLLQSCSRGGRLLS